MSNMILSYPLFGKLHNSMLLSKRLYISSPPKNLPNIYAEDTTKQYIAEEVHAYVGEPHSTVSSIE